MKLYNWQQHDWPNFRYDLAKVQGVLLMVTEKMGFINGTLSHLSESLHMEAVISLMIEEAVKTSQIEGEKLNRPDVRSSIKNKLGLTKKPMSVKDKKAQGIAELMLDVRDSYKEPLSDEKLFDWHLMVMSGTYNPNLQVGRWRIDEEPMQIISGPYGNGRVYFEAPPSKAVPKEMAEFIHWFNTTAPGGAHAIDYAPVRAAIAHLYFESIHPFDDGNGRIGRAIAEKALSQGFGYPVVLSLSQAIEAEKKTYYTSLHAASKSNEISDWIHYFVTVVLHAQIQSETQINFILKKAEFFNKYKDILNERQLKVVKRMLQAGWKGFEGGMSSKKYMIIAATSKASATRDLQQLLSVHAVTQIGSGRSVRYNLNL